MRGGERKALDQPFPRDVGRRALADDRDDLVDVVERDPEAFENMGPVARLVEIVLRAPLDDDLAVLDVVADELAQREHLGFEGQSAAGDRRGRGHERQHVEAEAALQRRVLVELVEHDVRRGRALQFDHDARPAAARLVVEAGDARNRLLLVGRGDRLDDARGRHLEGHLGDDDLELALLFDDLGLAAHCDAAATRLVRLANGLATHQEPAGREVGTLHDVAQRVVDGVGIVVFVFDQIRDRVADLADVVRRNVGRHADRNST